MSVLDKIKVKAKADVKHVVLPEGEEERTIRARRSSAKEGIAKLTLARPTPKQSKPRRNARRVASRALKS